jgi:DNA-binding Lrp family transcriptional regulator
VALNERQESLVTALQDGLPLTRRPYEEIGRRAGLSEDEVMEGIRDLLRQGVIKRLGVVVHHRAVGFAANAMVVWDVPDESVDEAGEWLGAQDGVTLCYRRPRRPPRWPYNLFCMLHGRNRGEVRHRIQELRSEGCLSRRPYSILFSARCFKQRGARYRPAAPEEDSRAP